MRGERRRRAIAATALIFAAAMAAPLLRARGQQLPPATVEIAWRVPDANALPSGIWKDTVLYGRRLFTDTPALIGPEVGSAAMRYAGNNLSCQSCHLAAGAQAYALPMV